jgi:hypothetical protein
MPSFAQDAMTELLQLPPSTLPQDLHYLCFTNVNIGFLDQVAQAYAAEEHRDVFGALMTTLSKCSSFVVVTYQRPTQETIEVLDEMKTSLGAMGVRFSVWLNTGEDDNDERLLSP